MNRRTLIQTTGITALALLISKPILSFAQTADNALTDAPSGDVPQIKELELVSAITNNHGHAFAKISLTEIVLTLQQIRANNEKPVTVSIKGTSGHDHTVDLNTENLLQLLLIGQVELTSSGVGHTHKVGLQLIDPIES